MTQDKEQSRFVAVTDDDFKKRVQIKAIKEGRTIQDLIIELLKRWLNERVVVLILVSLFLATTATADISKTRAVRAIIGEASNQGYKGMLAVAVGIRNRGTLKGVYGVNAKHVDKQPRWVWDMAERAWKESENNRIHSGTHWENIEAFGTPYWVSEMVCVYSYKDHMFYKPK